MFLGSRVGILDGCGGVGVGAFQHRRESEDICAVCLAICALILYCFSSLDCIDH